MKYKDELLPGGKNNPFVVPEGFFEEFKSDMLDYTDKKERPKATHILRFVGKYAAILCILFFAVKGVISTFDPDGSDTGQYLVSSKEIDLIYRQIPESEFTNYVVEVIEEDPSYNFE